MNNKIYDILKEYYDSILSITISPEPQQIVNAIKWFEIADLILKSIYVKDLYIEPIYNEIDRLKFFKQIKTYKGFPTIPTDFEISNVYLNESYKKLVFHNVKCFEFNSFYPTLIIKLTDNKIITIDNMNYYSIFKYLFINKEFFKNTDVYIVVKVFINYFYGLLSSDKIKKINCENFHNFENYKYLIFHDIKNKLKNDLIYLDTDCFYYLDNNYTFNFDIPYNIEKFDYFIIFEKKKYLSINGEANFHGFKYYMP